MAGTKPKVDRELLGRVAALTPGQQRWLRTVLQSIFTMEPVAERPRPAKPRTPEREPRRHGLDDLLSGRRPSEDEYPDLADELRGIAEIADLLRQSGSERRRRGEDILRRLKDSEGGDDDDEEDGGDEGTDAGLN